MSKQSDVILIVAHLIPSTKQQQVRFSIWENDRKVTVRFPLFSIELTIKSTA